MKILRITILILIGIVSLTSVNQLIFQTPAMLALGSIAVLFLAAISILGFPLLQKQSIFSRPTLWLIGCLLLQLILLIQAANNLTSDKLIPYTIVEMTLLLLFFGFAYKASSWLKQFDKQGTLTAVSTAAKNIPTLDQAETAVHTEITRSRHYERPLAIIAFHSNKSQANYLPPDTFQDSNQNARQQSAQEQVMWHIRSHMQPYQQLIRDSKNNLLYLVCPEFDYASAEKFGQQISESIASQTGLIVHYASAAFPEDGFTFNKIRKEALERLGTTEPAVNNNGYPNSSGKLSA